MIKIIAAACLSLIVWSSAYADNPSSPDTEFQSIITQQLEAFKADDANKAYSFAAPLVHKIFPDMQTFMSMVQQGYPPVYRNKQYSFGGTSLDAAGRQYEKVEILGQDGVRYAARYYFEQQPDGSWKISGVVVALVSGSDV